MAGATLNSKNPANSDTATGAFREILGKFLAGVDDMTPAVVLEYDRDLNRASVQPLIRILKTDGTLVTRGPIASIPVMNMGGGNIVFSFPIKLGDFGWIKACDRDISLLMQQSNGTDGPEEVPPNTLRKHSFSDGIFIPDQFKKWTLDFDDDAVVLQTLDSLTRISLKSDLIKISSSNTINLTAPNVSVNGDIFITGDTQCVGDLVVFGAIRSTGNINSIFGDVAAGAISLKNHLTTLVTPGVGVSGPPV